MRYLLIFLTFAAAVAFVLSIVVEVGWTGHSQKTVTVATSSAPATSAGPSASNSPRATATTVVQQTARASILAYYFAGPDDVKVSASGHVFVADTLNNRVVELGR